MDICKEANYEIAYEKKLGSDISFFLSFFNVYAFEMKPKKLTAETGTASATSINRGLDDQVDKPKLHRLA